MLGVTSIVRNIFSIWLLNKSYTAFRLDWHGGINILIAVLLSLFAVQAMAMVAPDLSLIVACCTFMLSLIVLRPLAQDELVIIKKGVGIRIAKPLNYLVRN